MISKTNPLFAKSDSLAKQIYLHTTQFPKHELYGVTSQMRRAALSVVLNIIEGFARNTPKEYKRFLTIAYASLQETKYLLQFSLEQRYLHEPNYTKILNNAEEVAKILWSTIYKKKKEQG